MNDTPRDVPPTTATAAGAAADFLFSWGRTPRHAQATDDAAVDMTSVGLATANLPWVNTTVEEFNAWVTANPSKGNYRINESVTLLRRLQYLLTSEATGNDPQQAAALAEFHARLAPEYPILGA